MEIVILDPPDIALLTPLLAAWRESVAEQSARLGIPLSVETALETFRNLAESPNAAVLAAVDEREISGVMGLYLTPYHMGAAMMAHECCFFVLPTRRSAGVRLLRAAEQWARAKRADSLIVTASRLAGDADRAGRFFAASGFTEFERSYLKGVR